MVIWEGVILADDRELSVEVRDELIADCTRRVLAFCRRRGRMPGKKECGVIVRRVLRGKLRKLAG